jgi:ATP-dependent DNA helicase RecG
VRALPGVTAAREAALAALGVERVEDLLRLAPRRYEDRRRPTPLAQVRAGADVLVIARVASSSARRLRGGVAMLEARLEDDGGSLTARWFVRGFLPTALVAGARYALFGPAREQRGRVVLVGPERERLADDAEPRERGLVPVHPLSRGLTAGVVRGLVRAALPTLAALPEPLPERRRLALGLPDLARAIGWLHFPERLEDAETGRRRLAFDELLLHDLLLERRRRRREQERAAPLPFPARVHERIRARLPYTLTPAQERATAEVVADLARGFPMHRLLQGEVGSGKTLVAAYALLGAVAAGLQGAVMAPTEVLARQHEQTLERLLAGSRVRLAALTGGLAAARRAALLARLAAGEIDVLVGTHALAGPEVVFRRLGLVVVDEEHKFGVRQRAALASKGPEGRAPHCLVMTATPIPRTLALTVYGDLDVSVIDGLPPGRLPVETWVVRPREGARVMARVRRDLAEGRQAFVVYPAVEGGGAAGLRDAVEGAARWQRALPRRRVGLLHGRLPAAEKRRVLDAFRARALDVLVATVVVEVGVDVPNASLLVVEHAERFGLTQLHQLRGRVGRGSVGGLCVLVDRSSGGANARLEVLARTHDGLRVAEEDLALRGVGDLVGTRQSGAPGFRAARLPADLPLLARARATARALLADDPALARPEHAVLSARLAQEEAQGEGAVAPD